jgi:hypothetical protein
MKRWLIGAAIVTGLIITAAARLSAGEHSFKTRLFGNIPQVVVRGIPSDFAPWEAGPSQVTLKDNGDLRVRIRGLLVAAGLTSFGTPVPAQFVGTNPVSQVRIAVTWAVPASVSPSAVFIQETAVLPLDANGNLAARTFVRPPPPGGERPVILVRAVDPMSGASGAWIASSDFPADFGSSVRDEDENHRG